jgi:hypothetical protein
MLWMMLSSGFFKSWCRIDLTELFVYNAVKAMRDWEALSMVSSTIRKRKLGTKHLSQQYMKIFGEPRYNQHVGWDDEHRLDQPPMLRVAETYVTYNTGEMPAFEIPGMMHAELE